MASDLEIKLEHRSKRINVQKICKVIISKIINSKIIVSKIVSKILKLNFSMQNKNQM